MKAYNHDFESYWSNIENITIIPKPNSPPLINLSLKSIEIFEDIPAQDIIKLNDLFIDPDNDLLKFSIKKMNNISIFINDNNNALTLTPRKDWNGNEILKVSANDTEYNISINIEINVLGVNDPPSKPIIIEPLNQSIFSYSTQINFSGFCTDPDLIYGDNTNYSWISNISGFIGFGSQLRNVELPVGSHNIFLKVNDLANSTNKSDILIKIISLNTMDNETNLNNSDMDNDSLPDKWEQKYGLNSSNKSDIYMDFDNDNLINLEEFYHKTNPLDYDTDSDNFPDGFEIDKDTNPLDKNDYPILDDNKITEMDIIYKSIMIGIIIILTIFILFFLFILKYKNRFKK